MSSSPSISPTQRRGLAPRLTTARTDTATFGQRIGKLRSLFPDNRLSTGELLSPQRMSAAIARESALVQRKGGTFVVLHLYCRSAASARKVRRRMRDRMRLSDLVGHADDSGPLQRVGGVGIVALLPDTSASGAYALAVDLCKTLSERHRPTVAVRQYPETPADA
ncbi:MAG: hypothetical protein AAGD32_01300 [Planctomycetota bacterium]